MEWIAAVQPTAPIVLACPIVMIFMMRWMHGGHGYVEAHPEPVRVRSGSGREGGGAA